GHNKVDPRMTAEPVKVSLQFVTYWLAHPSEVKRGHGPGTVYLWVDPRILDRKFYADESTKEHPNVWTAVDNCGGEFFTEEFSSEADAVAWLTDPLGRTGDDWKADRARTVRARV
ncbi:MAG: hypothetical protein JRN07_05675, partial [Nitrososphaerota archaeon]|nr:hypothetical protein [Nitrososphaerota archaeon]